MASGDRRGLYPALPTTNSSPNGTGHPNQRRAGPAPANGVPPRVMVPAMVFPPGMAMPQPFPYVVPVNAVPIAPLPLGAPSRPLALPTPTPPQMAVAGPAVPTVPLRPAVPSPSPKHVTPIAPALPEPLQPTKRPAVSTPITTNAPSTAPPPLPAPPSSITFSLNGEQVTVENPDPTVTLNDYIRYTANLTGTKIMCGEGGCGACTVMLTYYDPGSNSTKNISANSCLRPLVAVDGMQVTTIEGIGSASIGYHPLQEQLAQSNGTQCGFCSPGMVMEMYSLLQSNPNPSEQDIENGFDGNMCRCTGYRPILSGFKAFAANAGALLEAGTKARRYGRCRGLCARPERGNAMSPQVDIEDLCLQQTKATVDKFRESGRAVAERATLPATLHPSRYPRALKCFRDPAGGLQWYTAASLNDVFSLLQVNSGKNVKLVVGNTSVGIFKRDLPDVAIDIGAVPELLTLSTSTAGVTIGAAVRISDMIAFLENAISANPGVPTQHFAALIAHLKRVANWQVRNVAAVAGNLCLARYHSNFPSDIATVLLGIGATVTMATGSPSNTTTYTVDAFVALAGSQRSAADSGQVVLSIFVPFAETAAEAFRTFKVAERHQNAHAYVNAAMRLSTSGDGVVAAQPTLAYGGVAARAVRANQTETFLIGKSLTDPATLAGALAVLRSEMVPDRTVGHVEYRHSLVLTFFYKFYLTCLATVAGAALPPALVSASVDYVRPISSGTQSYGTSPNEFPVSQPIIKSGALLQTAGEAVYTTDVSPPGDTLWAALVTSTVACGDIVSIDASKALAMPGVVAFLSASDIPGKNVLPDMTAPPGVDIPADCLEPIFAEGSVVYHGQAIGVVIADTEAHAFAAARHVSVTYANTSRPILTLDEAVERGSFFPEIAGYTPLGPWRVGKVEQGFKQSPHVVEGRIAQTTSQYHFTMETQVAIATPTEGGGVSVTAATQWPTAVQLITASVLGLPMNSVTVNVLPRVGGAYGARITRGSLAGVVAALAAARLGVSVKFRMDLATNMANVGKRHPYRCDYRVGFDDTGRVHSLKMTYYADGGCAIDSTVGTMDQAMVTCDNAYYFTNVEVERKLCRTNTPSNTFMRAPGCLPAIFFAEAVMEHIADYLQLPSDQVKAANFYTAPTQLTPWGQQVGVYNVPLLWQQIQASSDWAERVADVAAYNAANRWTKQGICLVPIKYGLAWAGAQYGVIISIFPDGSVTVVQAGIETGQGLVTKVSQIVAMELGAPLPAIAVSATTTSTMAFGYPTGGSITSELVGASAIMACQQLNARLAPFRKSQLSWQQTVAIATANGTNLTSMGYYVPSGPTATNQIAYFTYGVAASQVQIDVLTGEIEILRSDILYDCGTSLNPLIDIGQVEGAFVQGLGYFLTEQVKYDPATGRLTTDGTWEYKPPASQDIPIDFRVALLKNTPNPVGILGSKGSGEPPLALASSVFFAVKHAIQAARTAAGKKRAYFELNAPATVDRIHMACGVDISQMTF